VSELKYGAVGASVLLIGGVIWRVGLEITEEGGRSAAGPSHPNHP
jgi:hypothetical protein